MSNLRAHQLGRGNYPPTTRGLCKYLQETCGLKQEHAVLVVRATVQFVKTMVLTYGFELPIYKLGTFRRRHTAPRNTMPSLGVSTPPQYVLKFTASQQHGRIRLEE